METKDYFSLGLSLSAFLVSLFSLYFSHFHKPSAAVLSMTGRDYSPEYYVDGQLVSSSQRNIYYCLSDTGRKSLYVKEVTRLRGLSTLGNLRDHRPYTVLSANKIEPFVIDPGEVYPFTIVHDMDNLALLDDEENVPLYELLCIEIISADGKRYQMCHNITDMPTYGMQLDHPYYDGVPIGSPVRSNWLI